MSVKQRKLRAAKRAHHAKKSKQGRVQYNLSRVGINAHLDAGKLSTMDRILAPGASLSLNSPPSIQDIEGLLHTSNMHAITRALEELDVEYVKPKRRDEVIKAVNYALERDDFDDLDDLANHSILQLQLAQLIHQGEIVLVDTATGFPPPSQAIEMIVVKARGVWETSEEKLITPTADNIVDWLITYGQKICKLKIHDYLGVLNTGSSRGWFDDIDPEMFSRIRAMAGNMSFFPHFSQMQADVPDVTLAIAPGGGGGQYLEVIKGRIPDGRLAFDIDSLGALKPTAFEIPEELKDVEVEKPKDTPYGSVYFTTPQGKDDA